MVVAGVSMEVDSSRLTALTFCKGIKPRYDCLQAKFTSIDIPQTRRKISSLHGHKEKAPRSCPDLGRFQPLSSKRFVFRTEWQRLH